MPERERKQPATDAGHSVPATDAGSSVPATEHEPIEVEARRRSGDWLDTQHEYPVDSVGGEPVEPGLEDRASPLKDSGEPSAPAGGAARGIREPAQEPPRDPLVEAADPPEPR